MDDRPLDTSPEAYELYRFMLMQLSGEERLLRASRMFDAAREMILASFPEDLSPAEVRRRLYERIYGEPLPADFPLPPA
jgi:hypothetical protein